MKNFTLSLLACLNVLLITSNFLLAQKITVSEEVPLRSDRNYELIGLFNDQTLLFRDHVDEVEIQCFDSEMQLKWEEELDLDGRDPKVLGVQQAEDYFILLYRFRKKSKTIVKAHKYDGNARLMDSVTIKNYGFLFSTPNFEVIRSEDRTKVLIYYIDKSKIINAVAFDVPGMTMMWEKAFKPEGMLYPRDWQQILVDDTGNLHLILSKDNFRSKKKMHYFQIHQYFGMDDRLHQSNVSLNGKLTFDVLFELDNRNNQLVAAGLYGEKTVTKAMGYYYLRIPSDNPKAYTFQLHEFSLEMLSTFLDKKKIKKNRGLIEIVVEDVVLRMDGGVIAIFEKAKLYERRTGNIYRSFNEPFINSVDYYFEEMYIASIHPDGDLHWGNVLHKKQFAQDGESIYGSYFLFTTPSSLRFIFNDEVKYENTVSEYVLRGDGNYKRNSVLNTKDLKIRLRFRDAMQVNSKVLLVPSEMRNRIKIVKLEY